MEIKFRRSGVQIEVHEKEANKFEVQLPLFCELLEFNPDSSIGYRYVSNAEYLRLLKHSYQYWMNCHLAPYMTRKGFYFYNYQNDIIHFLSENLREALSIIDQQYVSTTEDSPFQPTIPNFPKLFMSQFKQRLKQVT